MKVIKIVIISISMVFCIILFQDLYSRINIPYENFGVTTKSKISTLTSSLRFWILIFNIVVIVYIIFFSIITNIKKLLFILLIIDICSVLFMIFIPLPLFFDDPFGKKVSLLREISFIIISYSIVKYMVLIINIIHFIIKKIKKQNVKDLDIKYSIIKRIDLILNIILVFLFIILMNVFSI